MGAGAGAGGPDRATCYHHEGRPASAVCRRCNRPICTDCMREAPVGFQCPACIHADARRAPVTRWRPRPQGTLGATRMTPVIGTLIAINVVVFLIELADPAVEARFLMEPILVPSQPYRLITAAFLHENFVHILFNMVVLASVGPAVEAVLGRSRTLALYLLAGLGGGVASYLFGPIGERSLGASGAIFGVMAAYYVLARLRGWNASVILPLILVNLVIGFAVPNIDWRDHLGGLAVGALVGAAFHLTERLRLPSRRWVEAGVVVVVLAVLVVLSRIPPGHVHL